MCPFTVRSAAFVEFTSFAKRSCVLVLAKKRDSATVSSVSFRDTRNERKTAKPNAKHNPLQTKSGDLLLCSSARTCLGCHQCHL